MANNKLWNLIAWIFYNFFGFMFWVWVDRNMLFVAWFEYLEQIILRKEDPYRFRRNTNEIDLLWKFKVNKRKN